MMHLSKGIPAVLAAVAVLSAQAQTPEHPSIDAVFGDYDSTQTPGCSLGVYRNGVVDYARGYGMANLEYGIANGPDTVFRIASTSKQFAAMAMAILAEQGKLSLDDEVRKYFPEMPDYGAPLTIRHMIHHSSGIRDYLELAWLADWPELYTEEEAVRLITSQRALNFPSGSEYLYSNSGYFLLSQIVPKVTGQSLKDWSQEHLFAPLGMTDTHFHDDHRHIVPRRADGYEPDGNDGFQISMTQLDMVGDGGIFTTVSDMLKWHNNFADNQLGKGGPDLIELMETPGRFNNGEAQDYAFGLGLGELAGHREISHGGAWMGYRAGYNRYPDDDLGVAVLCNHAWTDPTRMAREVAKLYLGIDESDEASGSGKESLEVVRVDAQELNRVTGTYLNAEQYLLREIIQEEGSLWYDRSGGNRSRLDPLGEGRYVMSDVEAQVIVSFDGDSRIPGAMNVTVDGGEPLVLARIERDSPSSDALNALVGEYYSPELDHTQQFRVEDGTLVAVRRMGNTPLRPLQEGQFMSEDGLVYAFDRDGAAFRVQSGRVRDVAYERR